MESRTDLVLGSQLIDREFFPQQHQNDMCFEFRTELYSCIDHGSHYNLRCIFRVIGMEFSLELYNHAKLHIQKFCHLSYSLALLMIIFTACFPLDTR